MPTAFVTVPSDDAATLARRLVDERLAACVNLVPCTSVYRWEGAVETDDETILLAKTTDDRYDDLADRVAEWHPHDVPCIERFDAADVHDPFAAWCAASVTPEDDAVPGDDASATGVDDDAPER